MKKIILASTFILATASVFAQDNFFSNISTTDQYQRYSRVQDEDKDGIYTIKDQDLIVKFEIKTLATGEGYRCEAIIDEGNSKGKQLNKMDALGGHSTCVGYPYESSIMDGRAKSGFVSIGNYVFLLYQFSKDGISYGGIDDIYVKLKKEATSDAGGGKKKKKKFSFKDLGNAIKDNYTGSETTPDYGAEHKELESKNLDKIITDYLVAMKSKQDSRTAAEKQRDKNLENAKNAGAEEIKRYNDSIRATPEYIRMKEHQRAMKNMDQKNNVTLYNSSSSEIYVGRSGSRNKGTRIAAGSKVTWNCDSDAYFQTVTKSGGSNAYSSTNNKAYSANSRCGETITIR
jgi:hypothetical protein